MAALVGVGTKKNWKEYCKKLHRALVPPVSRGRKAR